MMFYKHFLFTVLIACTFPLVSHAQSGKNGIGLRLGDPLGITYQNRFQRNKAFEFTFGKSYEYWYGDYYRDGWISDFPNRDYRGNDLKSSIGMQGRVLFYDDFPANAPGLEWYWGLGGMLRIISVDYFYRDDPGGPTQAERRSEIDLGPEGILGMQYNFQDAPVHVFFEINLMMEILDDPVNFFLPWGIGGRYTF